jgi:hypothetical protein
MRTLKPVNFINLTGEFTAESRKIGGGSVGNSSQQGDRNTLVVKFPRAQRYVFCELKLALRIFLVAGGQTADFALALHEKSHIQRLLGA